MCSCRILCVASETTSAGTLYFDTTWAVQTDVATNTQVPQWKPMRVSLWDLVTGDVNMTIKLVAMDYEVSDAAMRWMQSACTCS